MAVVWGVLTYSSISAVRPMMSIEIGVSLSTIADEGTTAFPKMQHHVSKQYYSNQSSMHNVQHSSEVLARESIETNSSQKELFKMM